jgi:hypothetical protein
MTLLAALGLSILLAGCSMPTPVLAPNAHLQEVGPAEARREIWRCKTLADQNVRPTVEDQARHEALLGYRTGEAVRPVGGVIYEHPKRGGNLGSDRPMDITPAWMAFVSHCLRQRGYEVTGWE